MIVYLITNLVNGKRYVGQTVKSLEKRWQVHKAYVKRGSSFFLHNAMRKYGLENFLIEPLVTVEAKQEMNFYESFFIKLWDLRNPEKGYNLTSGGEGALGRKVSKETKEKMRLKMTGKTMSEEARKKISESGKGRIPWNKGLKVSEETKRKLSLAQLGKPCPNRGKRGAKHSIETRLKMSEAHKGRIAWNKGLRVSEEYIRKTGKHGKITNANKGEKAC